MFFTTRLTQSVRGFSSSSIQNSSKVAVLGAAGGIGQPLSLLLKQSPLISHLSLFDIVNTPGVAADLSHINTSSKVTGHLPENNGLKEALEGSNVVVIPAGVPRKPGMTRDDLFNTNASIVRDLATACAKYCPKAHLLIISNPVNSTVPIVSEIFKKHNVYDPKRIFGVTTLDVVRASRFLSEVTSGNPSELNVPVVGGHSGVTIIPLFSKTNIDLSQIDLKALTNRVQYGGDEVVKAKSGTGSATLSMAHAGARFAFRLLEALNGKSGVIEPSYVKSDVLADEGIDYFSTNIELGVNGVAKIHGLEGISAYEQELVKAALPELRANIKKGFDFAQSQ